MHQTEWYPNVNVFKIQHGALVGRRDRNSVLRGAMADTRGILYGKREKLPRKSAKSILRSVASPLKKTAHEFASSGTWVDGKIYIGSYSIQIENHCIDPLKQHTGNTFRGILCPCYSSPNDNSAISSIPINHVIQSPLPITASGGLNLSNFFCEEKGQEENPGKVSGKKESKSRTLLSVLKRQMAVHNRKDSNGIANNADFSQHIQAPPESSTTQSENHCFNPLKQDTGNTFRGRIPVAIAPVAPAFTPFFSRGRFPRGKKCPHLTLRGRGYEKNVLTKGCRKKNDTGLIKAGYSTGPHFLSLLFDSQTFSKEVRAYGETI
ncbi:hypothetical protein CEXT_197491 [Caerostris extrusa]|uniref:Uncharacterized protein n=1 Tax=Caerostris extrusa TaxID=172846 RepID=A0AAV4VPG8_CAEEX|nr:hypothetical protein CEXT_197491 [Caerostris extrusa]